jgi:hypothetical protein
MILDLDLDHIKTESRHITECYIRYLYKRCKNKKFLDPDVVMINHFIPIEIPIDCTLHIDIPMECICRYIPMTMKTVLILHSIVHGVDYIRQ